MNPPRITTPSGRNPRARFHASWSPGGRLRSRKTVVRLLGVLAGLLAVPLVGIPVYATSFLSSLPDVHGLDAAALRGDTIIQARDGTQLADIGFREGDRRLTVTLDQVSQKLVDATVSIEDKTFWTNSGFDSEAIIRTAATNFRAGGVTGGASTITQQLAKRLFLSSEQSVDRKVKELVLAYELSKTYEKKKILELYLNETYYGDEQYGVQAAAQTYFHKDAKTVDLAQAAMLAGLPQAPDAYNPTLHLEAAQARQREVLDAMVRDRKITPQEAAAARSEKLQIFSAVTNYKAPHFVRYVEQELRGLGFKPGLQQLVVKTTLDFGKQQIAEKVVKENWQTNIPKDPDGKLSSSMVALDPQTGQIVVYVGGPDQGADCFVGCDFVTGTPVNPGSSLKPFTYAAAIRDGKITMETPIADGPSPYVVNWPGTPTYKVYNYDKATHGNPPARVALASSLNIPAVKVELAVGVPTVVELQRNLGLRPRISHDGGKYTLDDPATSFGPSLTLGGYSVTLLEEASAFATIAAMGTYHQPEAILQVTDVKGRPLYQADPNRGARPNALDPKVAFIIAAILVDDNNRAPIFGRNSKLHLPDRHSAAKTGTTENYHDALTFGFTPDLVTGVWVGDTLDFTHHMIGKSDAIYVAAPAWYSFMEQALKGVADKWYTPPKGLKPVGNSWFLPETTKVDRLPGDNPSPSPSGRDSGIPPDPGSGPQKSDKCPRVLPPIPIPIPCATP